jgi:hypothetical protein
MFWALNGDLDFNIERGGHWVLSVDSMRSESG